jgi:hypothetical protein
MIEGPEQLRRIDAIDIAAAFLSGDQAKALSVICVYIDDDERASRLGWELGNLAADLARELPDGEATLRALRELTIE